ncbi:MAG: CidA/LrgA family protein [Burkholderiales bacterium]
MLRTLAVLLGFQLAGEFLAQLLGLPIPGPVIGMALLFASMSALPALAAALRDTATELLQHLSLLFVPAGVGVMLHVHRVADEWAAIVTALVGSTVLTIVLTAIAIRGCARWWTERGPR